MIDIVVNFDQTKGVFQIYESTSKTLLLSQSLGEGFSNLSGVLGKSLLEDKDIIYHFDSYTFKEIIKSNISLLKRVSDIPSEFKNSISKFGTSTNNDKQNFSRGSKNFQNSRMKGGSFKKSFSKFNNERKT